MLGSQLGLVGSARNMGTELLIKRVTPAWTWLLSYTLARAQRHDGPGQGWRPFELDQRHNLNVAASRTLGPWRLGARVHAVSGMPYSPVIGSTPDGAPVYDPYAGQLPAYLQFDIRVDRIWPQCWGTVDLYFDIQNITNRRNVEGREADELNRSDVDIRGLPIMPFIGVEFIPS